MNKVEKWQISGEFLGGKGRSLFVHSATFGHSLVNEQSNR